MTDKRTDQIRELERRISEWEIEQSVAIQQERDGQEEFDKTLSLSFRIVAAGSIPSVVRIVKWCWRTFDISSSLWDLFWSLLIFGVIALASARASGLAMYLWFGRKNDFVRLATIVAALAASAILFGWTIIFTQ